MSKVLIITYYWPPSGGAGVQRWLKFSKYLPEYGWEPVILTVDPAYAAYPALDNSLNEDVNANLIVFKTKATDWFRIYSRDKSRIPSAGFAKNYDNSLTGRFSRFIRGNFFIPDPRRGWNKFAFAKACEIITSYDIKHIVTTSPPHSTQMIGIRLKKAFPEIKWVSDLRDAWTDIYYYDLFYPTRLARAIDRNYEKEVVDKADKIITVGKNLAETFGSMSDNAQDKIQIIPNGYDDDDFRDIGIIEPERFTITYIGTLSEAYPVEGLLAALEKITKSGKDFLLRFAGSVPEDLKIKITSRLGGEKVEFMPYLEHRRAIGLLAISTILLLIIPDTAENNVITPGKVFEYLATGKPVLYIGPPEGDAAFHLKSCGHSTLFDGQNPAVIADFISGQMSVPHYPANNKYLEYSRKSLTQKLSEVLKSM